VDAVLRSNLALGTSLSVALLGLGFGSITCKGLSPVRTRYERYTHVDHKIRRGAGDIPLCRYMCRFDGECEPKAKGVFS
jgi:hypothetical protein